MPLRMHKEAFKAAQASVCAHWTRTTAQKPPASIRPTILAPPVILLHYDYMVSTDPSNPHSDAPNPEIIRLLVEAFKQHGITLVIDPRHAVLPHYNFVGFGEDGARCAEVEANHFAFLGWGGPTTTFEALKAQYFHPQGNVPWHYAIFGHTVASIYGGASGSNQGVVSC